MADFNLTVLIGRLTDEPALRYTTNGTPCAEFSVAVNRKSGGDRQETLFLGCVAWGKTAENISRYLQKGASCLVRGFLRQESWQGRDGVKRSTIKLICEEVQFLERRQQDAPSAQPAAPPPSSASGHRYSRADIPESMNPAPPSQPPSAPDPHIEDVNVDDIPF